jgi:hypothetical protein
MHIVVVVEYDADDQTYPWKLRAYSDGVQCYSNSKPEYNGKVAVAGVNSGNIVIGNVRMEGDRPFCGMISDVRVYDTVLSAQEVTTIYNEKVANWNNYVVGCWNMDEIEEKEGNRVVKPVVPSQVDLVAGTSVELSADAISGLSACFPNLNTSSLYFELPYAMKEISFGVYVNVSTNLMALEKEANNNKVPHVFNFPSFSRMCIQNEFRELKSNGAKVFDVATLDNANDQGFNCPFITHQKGRWSHLGVTYEMKYDENAGQFGVQPRIYVDGELVTTGRWQTASTLTGVFPKGTTFILGNLGVGSARPFGGLMDDFFFYSGRLSDSQMKDLSGGLPSVSAGANFTVAAATARVCGELGLTGVLSNRAPCAVSSQWSVVSTPKGGEAAMIESPANICSTVSLPVEGEYVLRLTIKDLLGREKSSDVAVTRVPSPADNVSPAISVRGDVSAQVGIPTELYAEASDPDNAPGLLRVSWKMLSGPGAVRFEPAQGVSTKATFFVEGEYRIVAVATDGATEVVSAAHTVTVENGDAIDLANGLIGYWPFDGSKEDKITKAAYTANGSASLMGSVVTMEPGVDKAAIRCHGAFYPYLDTSRGLQEEEDPDLSTTPKERYRAFSCWIYHDSSDTNNSSHATIVDVPFTLGLWYNCENGKRGFTMYQQTLMEWNKGNTSLDVYDRPEKDPLDRWTHVYALFDRRTNYIYGTSELWIDGIRQNCVSRGMGGGRVNTNTIRIGGHANVANANSNNGHFKDESRKDLSRTFPGLIDEMRLYNRKLSEAEIKYLASHPVVDLPRYPAVSGESDSYEVTSRKTVSVEVKANTDVSFAERELTYAWSVLSGDPSHLVFSSPAARITDVKVRKAGLYVLQLAVSDGDRTTYSNPIRLTVRHSGTVVRLR